MKPSKNSFKGKSCGFGTTRGILLILKLVISAAKQGEDGH
jgi:hypothetical protein